MPGELPADLLRPIIAHVSQNNDLCALALVSSTFREEAQRALFETALIAINGSTNLPLLDTIIASPNRLALMTRRATVTLELDPKEEDVHGESGGAHNDWFANVGPKTRRALRLMNQLTSVQISCHQWNARHERVRPWMESLLEGCQFKLKVLIWDVLNFDLKNLLLKSLANQANISFLAISCEYKAVNFREIQARVGRTCKEVSTLSAPWELICSALACGTVICHLQVANQGPESARLTTAAQSIALHYVESLWYSGSFHFLGIKLEDLMKVGLLQFEWPLEEDYPRIAALPKLKVLILLSWSLEEPVHTPEVVAQMAQYLFFHSASLTTIYTEVVQDQDMPDTVYTCYTYDSTTGEVQMRPTSRREIGSWRQKCGLGFVDID